MRYYEICVIAIGIAMDAFAVSICKGLSIKKNCWKIAIKVATYFGIFQAGMPILGYIIGNYFNEIFRNIDHWIAFILLGVIGIDMIKESCNTKDLNEDSSTAEKGLLILAIATSIDAFAVGITFSFFYSSIIIPCIIIGNVTFALSIIGTIIGNKYGKILQNKAKILGGSILILIGFKILIEHLIIYK